MRDSLGSNLNPSLTTDPKLSSFGNNKEVVGLFQTFSKGNKVQTTSATDFTQDYAEYYIELQYHGTLKADAIESIFIPQSELHNVNMTTLNKFKGKFKIYTEENGKLKEIF
jgi:hypothetical protein